MKSGVILRVEASVAVLDLAHPPLNLVTRAVLLGIHEHLRTVSETPGLSVLVVSSQVPGIFSAGSDMKEFEGVLEDPLNMKILFEDYVLRTLERLTIPTIAAIDGVALGGGLELALCCDLRVVSERAVLGLPETVIGGLGTNGLVRLSHLVGRSRALDLVYTGRKVTAAEALDLGLVNRVVPSDGGEFTEAVRVVVEDITRNSQSSLVLAKRLANHVAGSTEGDSLYEGIRYQAEVFRSPDLLEGSRAFFEKRSPDFPSARGVNEGDA